MNDEQFEGTMTALQLNGYGRGVSQLRARDTAQREALARVEAERDSVQIDAMSYAEQRDTAQAQLAEAVGLLKHVKAWIGWGDIPESLSKLDSFLARHAQAEQQEARAALATQPDVKKTLDEMRNTKEWLYGYRAALNAASLEFRRANGTPGKVSKRLLEMRRATFTQPAVRGAEHE